MRQDVPLLGQPASVTRSDKEQDPRKQKGPWVRILLCFTCKTMEQMRDYPPNAPPEFDAVLHELNRKHGGDEPDPTRLHREAILRPEQKDWDNRKIREQILDQAWATEKGFRPSYYALKDTLQEDAAKCWKKHGKPNAHVGCSDYRADSRRIGNPAASDRKVLARELGRDHHDLGLGPRVFLCEFCPYESVVQQKKQDKYGDNYGR